MTKLNRAERIALVILVAGFFVLWFCNGEQLVASTFPCSPAFCEEP